MTNRLAHLPQPVKEALGYFEAFRRLGFPADDIYFALGPKGQAQTILRSQGLQFACDVGFLPKVYHTEKAAGALWAEASTLWNEAEDAETKAIWESSHARSNAIPFLVALHEKGFRFLDKDLN